MKLIFHSLLLVMLQSAFDAASCPPPCMCAFEEELEDNMSNCVIGDSTVNITWSHYFNQRILKIACQGTNFTCANLPQFDLKIINGDVVVEGCAPSMMRCVNSTYHASSTIAKMEIISLSGEYTEEDFSSFVKVNYLNMRVSDEDEQLPAVVLNSLPLLQTVVITGGNLNIHSNVFNQSRINYFRLEYNNIRSIPAYAFNGLTSLKELSIEGSNIESIDRDSFKGLEKLEDLLVANLIMTSIDLEVFLAAENLKYLSLTDMQLQYIPNGFLERFKRINMIQISRNNIELILDSEAFARLPVSAEDIALSDCKLKRLPETLFMGSDYIQGLIITHNMIEELPPKIFKNLYSLKNISLMNNSINILSKEFFSNNKKMSAINLSFNNIEKLNADVFAANTEMQYLILRNNNISYVDINAFNGMYKLNKIDLSSNKLESIVNDNTLSWQTRRLNLSSNYLRQFENWFHQINSLIHLDLTYNRIKEIKEDYIYSFEEKIKIDLRYNKISHIIRNNTNEKLVIPKTNIKIYLSNNPFECDCLVLTILNEWKENGMLGDYEDIVCEDIGKLSNVTRKQVSTICNKEHAMVGLIGTSAIGALVLIILIISIYIRRKKLRHFISIILNKSTESLTTYEMELDSLKTYDLFISFAHQDAEFVTDELLVKLENEFGQKVCVHYRDWTVGILIPDQIVQSVENSRLTIIILTEHFLISEWSYLEFRTAHNLSIQEGKPRVIVILLDESVLQHEKLGDDLKTYINVNTYLLWGDVYFWDKLKNVLPRQGRIMKAKEKRGGLHALLKCGC